MSSSVAYSTVLLLLSLLPQMRQRYDITTMLHITAASSNRTTHPVRDCIQRKPFGRYAPRMPPPPPTHSYILSPSRCTYAIPAAPGGRTSQPSAVPSFRDVYGGTRGGGGGGRGSRRAPDSAQSPLTGRGHAGVRLHGARRRQQELCQATHPLRVSLKQKHCEKCSVVHFRAHVQAALFFCFFLHTLPSSCLCSVHAWFTFFWPDTFVCAP